MSRLLFASACALAAVLALPLAARTPDGLSRQEARGLAFARKNCSGCHGIGPNTTSANPDSPPFEDIANRPGITRQTLGTYLKDAHNFPAAMNFTVDKRKIGDLSAWIIRMQRPGYKPL